MNSSIRAYVQAKDDREGGDPEQFTFGSSIQSYRNSLLKIKNITLFDLNDAKSRPLVMESGYRLITAPEEAMKQLEKPHWQQLTLPFGRVGRPDFVRPARFFPTSIC